MQVFASIVVHSLASYCSLQPLSTRGFLRKGEKIKRNKRGRRIGMALHFGGFQAEACQSMVDKMLQLARSARTLSEDDGYGDPSAAPDPALADQSVKIAHNTRELESAARHLSEALRTARFVEKADVD